MNLILRERTIPLSKIHMAYHNINFKYAYMYNTTNEHSLILLQYFNKQKKHENVTKCVKDIVQPVVCFYYTLEFFKRCMMKFI